MGNKNLYFPNLDAIRFIAAFMVFLAHGVSPCYEYLPIKGTFTERLLNAISAGGMGVSIFFVLSGFLITYLLITEYELNSEISIKKFYIRRFLRIWPLYFAVVAFAFSIYPLLSLTIGMNNPLGSNIFYHLTFLSNFDVVNVKTFCLGSGTASQTVTWSVSIEEQFYLFWPLLFAFLPKRFWVYSIFLVIIGSMAFRLINYDEKIILYYHTFSVLVELGMGGLFACLIKKSDKIKHFFEESSTLIHSLFFAFAFALHLWRDIMFSFQYGLALEPIFISFSVALIISAQSMTKSESVLNLKNLKFATAWGKYTYGIYLIHPISLLISNILFRKIFKLPLTNFTNTFFYGVLGLVLTLVMAKMSYDYFESKFLKLKDKFSIIKTHQ